MKGLILGNIDYAMHMTDEGEQLQRGLEQAGWNLTGPGYPGGSPSVTVALDIYKPDVVLVHDKRDWDPKSPHSYRKDVGYSSLRPLRRSGCRVGTVLKDAGGEKEYQEAFARECGASYCVVYYSPASIYEYQPWTVGMRLFRTWQTMDAEVVRNAINEAGDWSEREGVIVSGAAAKCYPVRRMAFAEARKRRWHEYHHPGYGNKGCVVPEYLRTLAYFKVHIATASVYGFALRKIIESVACGCTPVTTLPESDVLPEIDGALVRIPQNATLSQLVDAVKQAEREWDPTARAEWSDKAIDWYDYRKVTRRLSEELLA